MRRGAPCVSNDLAYLLASWYYFINDPEIEKAYADMWAETYAKLSPDRNGVQLVNKLQSHLISKTIFDEIQIINDVQAIFSSGT